MTSNQMTSFLLFVITCIFNLFKLSFCVKAHYKKPKLNNKYEHIFPCILKKQDMSETGKPFLFVISYRSIVNVITFSILTNFYDHS